MQSHQGSSVTQSTFLEHQNTSYVFDRCLLSRVYWVLQNLTKSVCSISNNYDYVREQSFLFEEEKTSPYKKKPENFSHRNYELQQR